jgi:predicted Zn-dependent protease
MHDEVVKRFRDAAPAADFWSLRVVEERVERTMVRNGVAEPVALERDLGAMVTVVHGGGLGYAATSDLSASGLREAASRAREWAERSAGRLVLDTDDLPRPSPTGEYESPVERPWFEVPLEEKLAILDKASDVAIDDRIVDRRAAFWFTQADTRLVTSAGGDISQRLHLLAPLIEVIANEGSESQQRSLGVDGRCQQGGWEILDRIGFGEKGRVLAGEAVELLDAENCPTGTMDILLHPDQMMLQIHESIGHPLELDRILGDERNYAGRSFVTADMFGTYQYGSELLNVTYDPSRAQQFASYAWDDEGVEAERVHLIEAGLLKRGIGGASSQKRSGVPGTASARASSWNRPPIDRMSNLNVEAGDTPFEDLVKQVERGVFMRTNKSWSIDDSRNKFQFGTQWGQLIEDGELTRVVKNPNYRGVSASFWRSLKGVGDEASFRVLGEPYCGKGEPNQLIRVGHASPTCLFGDIAVFGAE